MASGIAEEARQAHSGSEKTAINPPSGKARQGFDLGGMGHVLGLILTPPQDSKNLDACVGIGKILILIGGSCAVLYCTIL